MSFVVQVEGTWIEWNPPVGLVGAIGTKNAWLAAATYARAIWQGASEVDAQQAAEKTAYCWAYRVRY